MINIRAKKEPCLEQYGTVSLDILDTFRDIPAEEFEQLAEENDLNKMSVKEAEELKKQLEKANEQISFLQSAVNEKEGELSTAQGRIENLEKEIDELQKCRITSRVLSAFLTRYPIRRKRKNSRVRRSSS